MRFKKRKTGETAEQEKVIKWCRGIGKKKFAEVEHIFSVPNEGKRTPYMAMKLKKEGMSSGVPDLFLPIIKNGYGGLWIEMKYGKNKLTKNQKSWIDYLDKAGYKCEVCYSADHAILAIKRYMINDLEI